MSFKEFREMLDELPVAECRAVVAVASLLAALHAPYPVHRPGPEVGRGPAEGGGLVWSALPV